ncbi:GDP-mannose 4,6-dehydratase [Dokdonella sp. MW10]|uniref:GDP-mannose 4,6-dehydratase n=1 Tax=Dokdonella sp. MW10 TaxID=2992926 RepID=UPI003F7FBAAD
MTSTMRALVTGMTGQDGAWLTARLLRDGWHVTGTHRVSSPASGWRLDELGIAGHAHLATHALDPRDATACERLVAEMRPTAVFHLAGQSRVAESFRDPRGSLEANGIGTVNLLEALRAHAADAHLVLASSAEIFGTPAHAPQDEATPTRATSPYGLSKLLAHAAVGTWRASFGLRASSAILFNHESELRDPAFVTRKITRAAARIALGLDTDVALGNVDAKRDFGYAPDYVDAMLAMASRPRGDDYVLASGQAASVRDFATTAFAAAGIDLAWEGSGEDEVARDAGGVVRIRIDPVLFRPVDAPLLVGDAGKARRELGFEPRVGLGDLCRRMVEADLARERAGGPR